MQSTGHRNGISVIIPVYNEERYINSTLALLLSLQTEVPIAGKDILLFLHGGTMLPENAFEDIMRKGHYEI